MEIEFDLFPIKIYKLIPQALQLNSPWFLHADSPFFIIKILCEIFSHYCGLFSIKFNVHFSYMGGY